MLKNLKENCLKRKLLSFFEQYFPEIGLGNVKKVEFLNSKAMGCWITTTNGDYEIRLTEELKNLKIFYMNLLNNGVERKETIRIQVWGRIFYKIIPVELIIDTNNDRQITNLITLETGYYQIDTTSNECIDLVKRSNKPANEPKGASLEKLSEFSRKHI